MNIKITAFTVSKKFYYALMDWHKMITFFIFVFISCIKGVQTWDIDEIWKPLPPDKSV